MLKDREYENKMARFVETVAIAAYYKIPEWAARVEQTNTAISKFDQDWVNTYMGDLRGRDDHFFEFLDSSDRNKQLHMVRHLLEIREFD